MLECAENLRQQPCYRRGHSLTKSMRLCRFRLLVSLALLALSLAGSSVLPPVVFSAKRTIRVMTYNIHVGVGMDKKLDLQRIADVINRERPDLVGLQEVDRGVERTERRDEIVELAALTRMEYAFAHNLTYQGGQYGVAILSRYPIRASEHRMFLNTRETERRGMIRVEVRIDRKPIHFATTHLDYQFSDGRLFEAEQLLENIRDIKGTLIVAGDFNDQPDGTTYKLMSTKFDDAWSANREKHAGFSYPADKPIKRIDYIFFRSSDGVKARRSWVVETLASDHIPVVADLEIR
jgi:endonuclease/exonuclease/phosphatase family metal-dependent hydrolase